MLVQEMAENPRELRDAPNIVARPRNFLHRALSEFRHFLSESSIVVFHGRVGDKLTALGDNQCLAAVNVLHLVDGGSAGLEGVGVGVVVNSIVSARLRRDARGLQLRGFGVWSG